MIIKSSMASVTLLSASIVLSLSGCKGKITDIQAPGLKYQTSSGIHGAVTENGEFEYKIGDTITFSLGSAKITQLPAKASVNLLGEKAANGSEFTDKALYPIVLTNLLQSIDDNQSGDLSIELNEDIQTWAESQQDAINPNTNVYAWTKAAQNSLPADWQHSWQSYVLSKDNPKSNAQQRLPIAASGNHHTYIMDNQGKVFSFGEDFLKWTDKTTETDYIGGKLGRTTDTLFDGLATPDSTARKINERKFRYNPIPAKVDGLEGLDVMQLVSGQNDGAVITRNGELFMWGPNNSGQLGLGDTTERRQATQVNVAGKAIRQVAIGAAHTHAITTKGELYSWGIYSAPLGLGKAVRDARENITQPTKVDLGDEKAIKVSTDANRTTLILTASGKVFAISTNRYGQAGNGTSGTSFGVDNPTLITTVFDSTVVDVFAGSNTSFFVTKSGYVYAAGQTTQGTTGRLLDGAQIADDGSIATDQIDRTPLTVPTKLEGFSHVQQFIGGSRHALALTRDQKVFTIGKNPLISGALGIGYPEGFWRQTSRGRWIWTEKYYAVPQEVAALTNKNIASINTITINSYATSTDGKVYGWGSVTNGRLAIGERNCDAVNVPSRSFTTLPYTTKRNYLCHSPREINLDTQPSLLHTDNQAETSELPDLPDLPQIDS